MGQHRATEERPSFGKTLNKVNKYIGKRRMREPLRHPIGYVVMALLIGLVGAGDIEHNPTPSSKPAVEKPTVLAEAPIDIPVVQPREGTNRSSRSVLRHEEQQQQPTEEPPSTKPVIKHAISQRQVIVDYALAQVGKPYVWAAAGPNAFDCSGLVLVAYKQIGIKLPRVTWDQINVGRSVSRSQLQPGDLVFSNGGGHVAIYYKNGLVIEAANPQSGVKVGPIWNFYTGRSVL